MPPRHRPIVGADGYPKGTGSGSRSFLAGRHWRSAARAQVTETAKVGRMAGGNENRKLTAEEETAMLAILEKALQQGAAGLSLGMMYEPGLYADVEELKKVAALCVKYNRPLTVHPRAESKVSMSCPQLLGRSHLLRAFDELVEIAGGTPLKLHYSHAIFVGRSSFKDKDELLRQMEALRRKARRHRIVREQSV